MESFIFANVMVRNALYTCLYCGVPQMYFNMMFELFRFLHYLLPTKMASLGEVKPITAD